MPRPAGATPIARNHNQPPRRPDHRGRPNGPGRRGPPRGRQTGRPSNRPDRARPPVETLFVDDHIVVINKPVGVVTAAIHARKATALDMTRDLLRARRERDTRVFVVHEVDRDASGVVVFARTPEASENLRRQFRSRKTDRLYMAVLEGEIAGTDPVTIRSRLIENRRGVAQSVPDHEAEPSGSRRPLAAVTHMRAVAAHDGLTLARIRAETDHAYQIRAHMAESGHPVGGDRAYGAKRREFPRLALHLAEVAFDHPVTGERVRYRAPTPSAFYTTVGKAPPRDATPDTAVSPEGGRVETHWDRVSEWYDGLLSDRGSDHYEKVLIPGVLAMLEPTPGQRILDVACGQGIVSRAIAGAGARVVGVDASPRLIERARELPGEGVRYLVGDARRLADVIDAEDRPFDAAVCVMALMNIDDLSATLAGVSGMLRPGGRFVAVILHPAFRAPRLSAWGWEGREAASQRQFRRVDAYLSESAIPITMNPGAHAGGADAVTTTTFHRPISAYITAARDAGLVTDALEEWASRRESAPGPRAAEENRARREIPMFLALRLRKPASLETDSG